MTLHDISVNFLGGPLHGIVKRLAAATETYLHHEGETSEVVYHRSHRWSPLRREQCAPETSAVFTTHAPPAHLAILPQA